MAKNVKKKVLYVSLETKHFMLTLFYFALAVSATISNTQENREFVRDREYSIYQTEEFHRKCDLKIFKGLTVLFEISNSTDIGC